MLNAGRLQEGGCLGKRTGDWWTTKVALADRSITTVEKIQFLA
jgi:hypothetical protein